jgi:hypothetical protein
MTFLILYWKPLLAGVVALALVAFGFYVQGLRSDNQALTDKLERTEARLASYAYSLELSQAALAAREKEAQAFAKEKAEANDILKRTYDADPEACAWANSRLPDAVYRQLCE